MPSRSATRGDLAVVVSLGGAIFVAERADDFSGVVEFVQRVGEHGFLAVVLEEGVSRAQFVVLLDAAVEETGD